jgi:hypothetical protein
LCVCASVCACACLLVTLLTSTCIFACVCACVYAWLRGCVCACVHAVLLGRLESAGVAQHLHSMASRFAGKKAAPPLPSFMSTLVP